MSQSTSNPASSSPIDLSEVVYVRTAPKRQHHRQPKRAAQPSTPRHASVCDGASSRPLGSRNSQSPRFKSKRSNTRRHTSRIPPRAAIPEAIIHKLVKIGWPRKSPEPLRMSVYGSFDRAGRFCRRVGAELGDPDGRPAEFKPIGHDAADYHPRFQGMTRKQVRSEVYGLLINRYGTLLEGGVV